MERNTAVDVFRGITIAMMIIVNNQGDWSSVYGPLRHAAWHGWLGADIVFPFFLFILGVSISLAFAARRARGGKRSSLLRKAVTRGAILVALGLLINLLPNFDFGAMRIPGVLQRIGICYLLAALMHLYGGKKFRWCAALVLLGGYGWMLLYLAPGGTGDGPLSPGGNLCLAVDRYLLGGHTYPHAPVPGFDPEGILSTLGALASTLGGTVTGDFLVTRSAGSRTRGLSTMAALLLAGVTALAAGAALERWIPINKNLWTPSYAIFMTGLALVLFSALTWIIMERRITAWSKPFLVLGTNAITAYVLSSAMGRFLALTYVKISASGETTLKAVIYHTLFSSWLPPHAASLAWAAAFLLFWTGAMYLLYRKRIFIRI